MQPHHTIPIPLAHPPSHNQNHTRSVTHPNRSGPGLPLPQTLLSDRDRTTHPRSAMGNSSLREEKRASFRLGRRRHERNGQGHRDPLGMHPCDIGHFMGTAGAIHACASEVPRSAPSRPNDRPRDSHGLNPCGANQSSTSRTSPRTEEKMLEIQIPRGSSLSTPTRDTISKCVGLVPGSRLPRRECDNDGPTRPSRRQATLVEIDGEERCVARCARGISTVSLD